MQTTSPQSMNQTTHSTAPELDSRALSSSLLPSPLPPPLLFSSSLFSPSPLALVFQDLGLL